MNAGSIATVPARFNCHGCGYRPVRVDGPKHACVRCGLVQWDGVALVHAVFGPGVEKVITRRRPIVPEFVWDSFDRWADV